MTYLEYSLSITALRINYIRTIMTGNLRKNAPFNLLSVQKDISDPGNSRNNLFTLDF